MLIPLATDPINGSDIEITPVLQVLVVYLMAGQDILLPHLCFHELTGTPLIDAKINLDTH